ncbi:SGNH hydrolase-type esterase domain-containing protein [Podospora appendiculata]|uniref:SGNH hydrolase-type esterase domain-containing protein n=1 Tax=Podospora appendiculata TaxID=314037 RepID=A0AAE0XIW6_9PEZI|nr:SGNH hydrolase-type esterase domain-containing protein [Podospora appendiculata]
MAGPRPKLRILCFGDSLTQGYSSMGAVLRPYATTLVQMLEMAFPELDIETVEDGAPGNTVKHGFLARMHGNCGSPRLPARKRSDEGFDWAIVLGGTNDLAFNIPPADIFNKLKEVWDVALRKKTKVLALTVPEAGIAGAEALDARRAELNSLVKGYKRKGFHAFDLHAAVPFFAMSERDRARFWDDAIHFTPAGYDLIGNKVGIALVSLLAKEKAESDVFPARRQRYYKDEEGVLEEEVGDPLAIDQGYIVIRRRDLE